MFSALCYSEFATRVPISGSAYTYVLPLFSSTYLASILLPLFPLHSLAHLLFLCASPSSCPSMAQSSLSLQVRIHSSWRISGMDYWLGFDARGVCVYECILFFSFSFLFSSFPPAHILSLFPHFSILLFIFFLPSSCILVFCFFFTSFFSVHSVTP